MNGTNGMNGPTKLVEIMMEKYNLHGFQIKSSTKSLKKIINPELCLKL